MHSQKQFCIPTASMPVSCEAASLFPLPGLCTTCKAILLSMDSRAVVYVRLLTVYQQCRIYWNIALSVLGGECRCADRLRLKPWPCQWGWDLLGCGSHWRPGLFSTRVVSGDRICVRHGFLLLLQLGKKGVVCLKQCCVLLTTVNRILELVN